MFAEGCTSAITDGIAKRSRGGSVQIMGVEISPFFLIWKAPIGKAPTRRDSGVAGSPRTRVRKRNESCEAFSAPQQSHPISILTQSGVKGSGSLDSSHPLFNIIQPRLSLRFRLGTFGSPGAFLSLTVTFDSTWKEQSWECSWHPSPGKPRSAVQTGTSHNSPTTHPKTSPTIKNC